MKSLPSNKRQGKPYIWLQDEESFGEAGCGCRLENGESPCLWLCDTHQAAEELREGLAELIRCAELVVREWDGGNLAEAVNLLRTSAEFQRAKFAQLLESK